MHIPKRIAAALAIVLSASAVQISMGSSAGPAQAAPERHCPARPGTDLAYLPNSGSARFQAIDWHSRKVVATVPDPGKPALLQVTPDGRFVFTNEWTSGTVGVFDTCAWQWVQHVPVPGKISFAAMSRDGRSIWELEVSGNAIEQLATADRQHISTITTGAMSPIAAVQSGDGRTLYVGMMQGVVVAYDTSTGRELWRTPAGLVPAWLTITPDDRTVYTANVPVDAVYAIDAVTGSVRGTIDLPMNTAPQYDNVTPDGTQVWTSNANGSATVISPATNRIIATVPTDSTATTVNFSPDGTEAFISEETDPSMKNVPGFISEDLLGSQGLYPNPSPGRVLVVDTHTFQRIGSIETGIWPGNLVIPSTRLTS